MLTLKPILEHNLFDFLALSVKPEQKNFVASPVGILARSYAYRLQRGTCFGICEEETPVGMALVYDLEEEPACYHLCEFFIDGKQQGKGYGLQALRLILALCRRERKFPMVEVCVKRADTAAIYLYEKAGFRDTGFVDPAAPDSLCLAYSLPEKCNRLSIRLTEKADLENVQRLWADPAVMHFVGFPDGLHQTMEHLERSWLPWVQQPPRRQHWSVYEEKLGYCGETYYDADETGLACMDIKLFAKARGRGIACAALSHALDAAFSVGGAKRAYVDPHPENTKALALYRNLGFLSAVRPKHLQPWENAVYMELLRENWEARLGN